jgi:hypothetical protein
MTIELLFIGELDNHQRDFLPFLGRHGYSVTVMNTSYWAFPRKIIGTDMPVLNLYEGNRLRFLLNNRIGWFGKASFYSLAEKAKLLNKKLAQVLKQEINVIFGSWGSHSLPELRLLHKRDIPVVYEFLTYPTLSNFAAEIENILSEHMINRLDGRILTSQRMLDYLRTVFGIKHGENIVFTECYSKRCFFRKRLPRLSEKDGEPHVIFIGSNSCEILPQIKEMLRRGIHVHAMEMKGFEQGLHGLKSKGFAHTFKKFGVAELLDGTMATFMTQFDACLETYDFRNVSVLDRFYNSTPDRFSFALTAGVPLIMPTGYLLTCEEIISRHQIGFTYSGYDDLRSKLGNCELMNYCQRNAVTSSKLFTLENNFEKIHKFLRGLSNNKPT